MAGEEVGYATPFRLHGVAFNNTSSPLSYVLHCRLEQPCGKLLGACAVYQRRSTPQTKQAAYPRVLGFWIFPVLETPLGVPLSTSLPVVLHGMRGYLEQDQSPQSPSLLCDCLHPSEYQIPASRASTTCTNNHQQPRTCRRASQNQPIFPASADGIPKD